MSVHLVDKEPHFFPPSVLLNTNNQLGALLLLLSSSWPVHLFLFLIAHSHQVKPSLNHFLLQDVTAGGAHPNQIQSIRRWVEQLKSKFKGALRVGHDTQYNCWPLSLCKSVLSYKLYVSSCLSKTWNLCRSARQSIYVGCLLFASFYLVLSFVQSFTASTLTFCPALFICAKGDS